jgi:phosphoribosyl-ATP pyrophosphohydrolase
MPPLDARAFRCDRMADTIARLTEIIRARRSADPASSYVAKLLAGPPERIAQKLGEEAVEAVIAAAKGDAQGLTSEAADLIFHLAVLLECYGLSFDDVLTELDRRDGVSGLAEKAARSRVSDAQQGD